MSDDLLEKIDEEALEEAIDGGGKAKGLFGKFPFMKKILGNKKRLIMIAAGLGLVIVLFMGIWIFFFSGPDEEEDTSHDGSPVTQEGIPAGLEQNAGIIFEDIVVLEPFERIPLKGNSAMGTISLTVLLELTEHQYRKHVYTMEDRIRNIISGQIREMTWLELRNPEGKIKLKYELLKRMNSIFPKVTVRHIYFTNFIMQ